MNLAALIGEFVSPVVPPEGDDAEFGMSVLGPVGEGAERVRVRVRGAQAESCRRFLLPGHRVAVEGRVVPGGRPAEVAADRVQFLTTRAQAEQLRTGRGAE
jgi:single-stranded DNA-binding protein